MIRHVCSTLMTSFLSLTPLLLMAHLSGSNSTSPKPNSSPPPQASQSTKVPHLDAEPSKLSFTTSHPMPPRTYKQHLTLKSPLVPDSWANPLEPQPSVLTTSKKQPTTTPITSTKYKHNSQTTIANSFSSEPAVSPASPTYFLLTFSLMHPLFPLLTSNYTHGHPHSSPPSKKPTKTFWPTLLTLTPPPSTTLPLPPS
jgi:predicted component of type VI protein secretion system